MTAPIKVLIIDDDTLKCQAIRDHHLGGYDCTVECVTSYESAVRELTNGKHKYDLIICDYNLPSGDPLFNGTGKMLKDSHLQHHSDCRFILYTAAPCMIDDNDARADCIAFAQLGKAITTAIYYLSQPKTESERPATVSQQEADGMLPKVKLPIAVIVSLVVLGAGIVSTWAVGTYKIDSTAAKVVSHCSDDVIFREKLSAKLQESSVATARLEEQTKQLKESVDALIKELRKQ